MLICSILTRLNMAESLGRGVLIRYVIVVYGERNVNAVLLYLTVTENAYLKIRARKCLRRSGGKKTEQRCKPRPQDLQRSAVSRGHASVCQRPQQHGAGVPVSTLHYL